MRISLIVLSVLSVFISLFLSLPMQTETVYQQLVQQNYLTHGLLFALFFIGLALLCNKPADNQEKK